METAAKNETGAAAEEAAGFQRIWLQTISKMAQATVMLSPNASPPDAMRQVRSGILKVLADSWEEFMRSPEFLEGTRQMMENAIAFRKLTNDFTARIRTELQAPSKGDIDTIMLTVRHMEKRLLDRIDELSTQVNALGSGRTLPAGRKRTRGPAPENRSAQSKTTKNVRDPLV